MIAYVDRTRQAVDTSFAWYLYVSPREASPRSRSTDASGRVKLHSRRAKLLLYWLMTALDCRCCKLSSVVTCAAKGPTRAWRSAKDCPVTACAPASEHPLHLILDVMDEDEILRHNMRVRNRMRAAMRNAGFVFCDELEAVQDLAQPALRPLPKRCCDLVDRAVCASTEDHPDQSVGESLCRSLWSYVFEASCPAFCRCLLAARASTRACKLTQVTT
jgi:hypothetical protein